MSRVAFGGPDEDEDAEEIATPTRQFSLLKITSGLPDDSREADERAAELRLRSPRGRFKAARAAISGTLGAAAVLRQDWVRAARLCARFGITELMMRYGPPSSGRHSEGGVREESSVVLTDVRTDKCGREESRFPG